VTVGGRSFNPASVILPELLPKATTYPRASSLSNLGRIFIPASVDLPLRSEALERAEEALAIHRELAAARPDAFRPDLVTAAFSASL